MATPLYLATERAFKLTKRKPLGYFFVVYQYVEPTHTKTQLQRHLSSVAVPCMSLHRIIHPLCRSEQRK